MVSQPCDGTMPSERYSPAGRPFGVAMVTLSYVLGPKKITEYKQAAYECGVTPSGDARERFPIKFYLVAMLFILFDIEVIFMYPWAVELESLGWYGFFQMLTFMAILTVGLVYVWRKGVLDWNE